MSFCTCIFTPAADTRLGELWEQVLVYMVYGLGFG